MRGVAVTLDVGVAVYTGGLSVDVAVGVCVGVVVAVEGGVSVGVLVAVDGGASVDVLVTVAVGVGVGRSLNQSQNLFPVSVALKGRVISYSIQSLVFFSPPTVVASTET